MQSQQLTYAEALDALIADIKWSTGTGRERTARKHNRADAEQIVQLASSQPLTPDAQQAVVAAGHRIMERSV